MFNFLLASFIHSFKGTVRPYNVVPPESGLIEMEFLDINVTKDSSLLLHAIHSLFYWRIW